MIIHKLLCTEGKSSSTKDTEANRLIELLILKAAQLKICMLFHRFAFSGMQEHLINVVLHIPIKYVSKSKPD